MIHLVRLSIGALLALGMVAAHAEINASERAERWWDASRADRIGFSDQAAAQCKSRNCDSLQIRSCINEDLKPPIAAAVRNRTLGEVTALCIGRLKANQQ